MKKASEFSSYCKEENKTINLDLLFDKVPDGVIEIVKKRNEKVNLWVAAHTEDLQMIKNDDTIEEDKEGRRQEKEADIENYIGQRLSFFHTRKWGVVLSQMKKMLPFRLKRGAKRSLLNLWESTLYHLFWKRPGKGRVRYVIFVCKGNICRSAFAEHYLRQQVPKQSLRVESCGLDVAQGTGSPPEAVKVAREFSLHLETHYSKGVKAADLKKADLILAMEYRQYLKLVEMFPDEKGKIRVLRDFSPWPARLLCNIYDPFGWGEKEFRRCFRRIRQAIDGLKEAYSSR